MAATLVLLHGFTHTGASWDRVLAAPGAERYRALAPDIRGHGSASQREPVDLSSVIDDVLALTDGSFVLAGYSMGGRIGLHVALARPDRVERLILVGASPGLADPAERRDRREADERLAARVERMSIGAFATEWAQTPVLAGLSGVVAAEVHRDRLRSTPLGLARALRGLGTGALPSLWDRLGELRLPVSLIVGERDVKFRAVAERMAAQLPRAELTVAPGTGHAVHLEAPERVAAALGSEPDPGRRA